jgi:Glycosyl transferases group 1/Glycosyltransferase Family 4
MRILHLDSGAAMRGGQWQVYRLIEGLAAAGVECTLLARAGSPLLEKACSRGWRAEPVGLWSVSRQSRHYDLVHAHDARSHTLAAAVGRAPLVVSRRVAFGGTAGPVSRWKYGRAAHYIAVSEFVKSVLVGRGVPESRVGVIYDGVPLLEAGRAANPPRVLAPANAHDPQKGVPLAMEAARLAGIPLELSIHLERDLSQAAAFVYITHSEGLGSAVLLAMSAGIPVVASKVGGLPEVIRHGENGLLVDNTAEAIAAALRELLDRPGLAQRLGAAARQTVIDRFTVDAMVRRTMEIYRQVLS